MTTPQDDAPLRGRIAARIRAASEAPEDAQARQLPAPVVLALARRVFATAGLASIWLDENAPLPGCLPSRTPPGPGLRPR